MNYNPIIHQILSIVLENLAVGLYVRTDCTLTDKKKLDILHIGKINIVSLRCN